MPDNKKLKVLYLSRWYPNRFDPMPGLFIQRHAEAVALYADVALVYTHAVDNASLHHKFEIDYKEKDGVKTAKVYFENPASTLPVWSHLLKTIRFLKANYLGIKSVSKRDIKLG